MTSRRVLLAPFGSAGDLFPLIPVAERLRAAGHEVLFVAGRSLGLYLRSVGLPAAALGTGAELQAVGDADLYRPRFGGWSSWRHTVTRYVAPTLADDVCAVGRVLDRFDADLVVSAPFAPAARIVAAQRDIEHRLITIYPQLLPLGAAPNGFAPAYQRSVARIAGDRLLATWGRPALAWGSPDGAVLLHDDALLGAAVAATGYPSWDQLPGGAERADRLRRWLDAGRGPAVLVTLGSFVGLTQGEVLRSVLQAAEAVGVRAAIVGPGAEAVAGEASPAHWIGSYVPHAEVAPWFDALVHHGGLGTTFAALRAGRPAVVVPQAFDQPHNASLLERTGAGIDGTHRPLEDALREVLSPDLAAGAAALGARLVPPDLAADRAARHLLEPAGARLRAPARST